MKKILMIAFCISLLFITQAMAQEESEMKSNAMSGFGIVADWRVKFFFSGGFYANMNGNQYFWTAEDVRLKMNTGTVPISETSISDHRWMGVLVGKSF